MGKKGEFKVIKALEKTQEAVNEVNKSIDLMSDAQRRLFVSLAAGHDPLTSLFEAGDRYFINDRIRIVHNKTGKRLHTAFLKTEDLKDLDAISLQRLQNAAVLHIKDLLSVDDVTKYIPDIQQLFKLVAPDAFQVLNGFLTRAEKETTQLKAATEILDRAGYQGASKTGSVAMPVQVNILMNGTPQAERPTMVEIMPGTDGTVD